jgi:type II secretory pathway predicted ATPase ExeA
MYLEHYKLIEHPFQTSPDSKFLWLGQSHKEALDCLMDGILNRQGFLLLTGDIGTGKTTLINSLVETLKDDFTVGIILDPALEELELFNFIANSFALKKEFKNKLVFLLYFLKFLIRCYRNKKNVLIIIDEAHRIDINILEELQLILDLDRYYTKILNIFLVGQSEFNTILLNANNLVFRERITVEYNIEPLTPEETREYIQYRLKVAGNEREIFTPRSILEVYAFSKGCPRLINTICDRALLKGHLNNLQTITTKVIKELAHELTLPGEAERSKVVSAPKPKRRKRRKRRKRASRRRRIVVSLSLALLIIVSGLLLTSKYHNESLANISSYYGKLFEGSKARLPKLGPSLTKMAERLDSIVAKITPLELKQEFNDLLAMTKTQHSLELAVAAGAISKNVLNHEPVGSGTSFSSSLGKLYCFTKVTGAQSPTQITHVWYLEGTERARIDLAVNSASWRTYSTKTIHSGQLGEWQVDILDSVGTVLKTLKFEVKP